MFINSIWEYMYSFWNRIVTSKVYTINLDDGRSLIYCSNNILRGCMLPTSFYNNILMCVSSAA